MTGAGENPGGSWLSRHSIRARPDGLLVPAAYGLEAAPLAKTASKVQRLLTNSHELVLRSHRPPPSGRKVFLLGQTFNLEAQLSAGGRQGALLSSAAEEQADAVVPDTSTQPAPGQAAR